MSRKRKRSTSDDGPPKWLVEYWAKEPNWIKRFQRGSDLNASLCGVNKFNKSASMWKPKAVKQFLKHMKKVGESTTTNMILYRGTWSESPTYQKLDTHLQNCQFISTSKSKSIAKEFVGKKGFLHTFHVSPGVTIYDFINNIDDDIGNREKEVLIYPRMNLSLIKRKGKSLIWKVSAN